MKTICYQPAAPCIRMVAVVIVSMLAGICSRSAFAYTDENEALLSRLDSILENPEVWDGMKRHRIAEIQRRKDKAVTLEEDYWLNKQLYNEYSVYDADSAMTYAVRNLDIARRWGDEDKKMEWNINRSFLLSVTGLLREAQDIVDSIDMNSLPEDLKTKYFNQGAYLYSHFGQYQGDNRLTKTDYYVRSHAYQDSAFRHAPESDPLYLWHKSWAHENIEGEVRDQIKAELIAAVDSSAMDTREDAMKAYALSRIYKREGDRENRLKYLIKAAICDIRISNKDIASLEEIGKMMLEDDNIDRAYTYIDFCQKRAQEYHNRIRALSLAAAEKAIREKYSARDASQRRKLHTALWVLFAVTLILVFAVVMIIQKNKRLVDSRRELESLNRQLSDNVEELTSLREAQEQANHRLKEMNGELTEVNDRLAESNLIKEEYVGQMFSICSEYINKIDSFRKDVARKLKSGQSDALLKSVTSTSMVQSELKEFYRLFDSIFLNIFPNFVNDFNELLRPEERITLAEGDLLNTPLRIYALVRLGINDSVKIAALLHCSSQTVYNNRLRIRNKAVVPKEDFADTVRTIGRFKI